MLFILAVLFLFVSPSIVLSVWLCVFSRMSGRGSTAISIVAATLAAAVLTIGFFGLAGWTFADAPP